MFAKSKRSRKVRAAVFLIGCVLLLLAAIMYAVSRYKRAQFGDSQLDEILFYLANGLADGQTASFTQALYDNAFLVILLFLLLLLPIIDFYRNKIMIDIDLRTFGGARTVRFNPSRISLKVKMIYVLIIFGASLWYLLASFNVGGYIRSISQSSQLFEQHYVDPRTATITFPQKKRNLVYIYLESMENTLASAKYGGQMDRSRIPELEVLALDSGNASFSNQASGLGGALPVAGTGWTSAGMAAQSMGVPLKQTLFNTEETGDRAYKQFLPGAWGLGDVLAAEGYNQSFIMGSRATFGGRDVLLEQHGNYTILDFAAMQENGTLPPDYGVWWGYEDRKLFQFAREEITRLAATGKPFNVQMLTADTHFPDGYLDPTCQTPYQRQYDNVHACSSARVMEFVRWIQTQSFGDNTTIVIVGDHLGMQTAYYDDIITDAGYQRTIYNVFVNSAVATSRQQSRLFSTLDLYPTTLAAMGAKIKDNRLGLGTNLFSDEETLMERYGSAGALSAELEKRSDYYEKSILTEK